MTGQVYVCRMWMMHYNHPCPKRSVLWSSNHRVARFDKGVLRADFKKKQQAAHGHVQPVKKSIGKDGVERYSGTAALKGTQNGPQLLLVTCTHD